MATREEVNAFIESIAPIVVSVCKRKSKKILPSVCIAQACQETGYGTTEAMRKANGYFGIKVGKKAVRYGTAWKGKSYSTKTHEYYDGKNAELITDSFRAYDTIEEAVEDYYDLLGNNPRFVKAIGETDHKKCIKYIFDGGYATNPLYVSTNTSIVKKNNLTKYDDIENWGNKEDMVYGHPKYKYKIGDVITVSSYYSTSVATIDKAIIKKASGTILNIKEGARNPYCFGVGSFPIGWCNEGDIRSVVETNENKREMYTVKKGDTISNIAKKYNTTVDNIINLNKDRYPQMKTSYIRVGWDIIVK